MSVGMAEVAGYHHVSLSVTDLNRSVAWYGEVLGLEVAAEIQSSGFRRVRLRSPNGVVTVSLTAHEGTSDGPFNERRTGMDHLAFRVGTVRDVEAMKRRFEELGVTHSAIKGSAETVMITLRDPDNIQLEVFGSD
jgi:glyoxylase I family protein